MVRSIPRSVLTVVAAVAITASVPAFAPAAAAPRSAAAKQPSAVEQAEARLAEARRRRADTATHLDSAAALYEKANAAAARLNLEAADNDADLDRATQAVDDARETLHARVLAAYKRPFDGSDPLLSAAVLHADDAATAMHQAAVLRQAARASTHDLARIDHARSLQADNVMATRVIAAGTTTAMQDLELTADALRAQLADASGDIDAAEAALADAREAEAARARIAAAQQAAQQAAPTTTSGYIAGNNAAVGDIEPTAPTGPLPSVAGKACPIGAPNGFIDSFGFPRSGGRTHQGVDMFAAYGTPLYAVASGSVSVGSNSLGGLTVNLNEPNGDYYYYAHLSAIYVRDGQQVRAGEVIGAVGDSGNAKGTPPHLHWEWHPAGGSAINPFPLAYALCR